MGVPQWQGENLRIRLYDEGLQLHGKRSPDVCAGINGEEQERAETPGRWRWYKEAAW